MIFYFKKSNFITILSQNVKFKTIVALGNGFWQIARDWRGIQSFCIK